MKLKKYSVLWLGIILAVSYWITEALTHSLVFHETSFFQELLPSDVNELWMRSFTSLLIIIFGFYANLQIIKIKEITHEREIAQKRLEEALANTLSEFIPICANCKRVRKKDSNPKIQQSWEQIESYIAEKSNAKFSHSICPECSSKLYG